MGKKKTASASMAASMLPEHLRSGTFTSLGDITKKVMQDAGTVDQASDEWTVSAIQASRRLTKKDEQTRNKAAAELRSMVDGLDAPPPSVEFASSFEGTFRRTMAEDSSALVRRDALHVVSRLVLLHKAALTQLLKQYVPTWLAARGDTSKEVATAAKVTFEASFPSSASRSKVLNFVAEPSRRLAEEEAKTREENRNLRALAVVQAYADMRDDPRGMEEVLQTVIIRVASPKHTVLVRRRAYKTATSWVKNGGDRAQAMRFAGSAIRDTNGGMEVWEVLLYLLKTAPEVYPPEREKIVKNVLFRVDRLSATEDVPSVSDTCQSLLPLLALVSDIAAEEAETVYSVLSALQGRAGADGTNQGTIYRTLCECCEYFVRKQQQSKFVGGPQLMELVDACLESFFALGADAGRASAGRAVALASSAELISTEVLRRLTAAVSGRLDQIWAKDDVSGFDAWSANFRAFARSAGNGQHGPLRRNVIAPSVRTLCHMLENRYDRGDVSARVMLTVAEAIEIVDVNVSSLRGANVAIKALLLEGTHASEAARLGSKLLEAPDWEEIGDRLPSESFVAALEQGPVAGAWANRAVLRSMESGDWKVVTRAMSGTAILDKETLREVYREVTEDLEARLDTACAALKSIGDFGMGEPECQLVVKVMTFHVHDEDRQRVADHAWQSAVDSVSDRSSAGRLADLLLQALDRAAIDDDERAGYVASDFCARVFQSDQTARAQFAKSVLESHVENDRLVAKFLDSGTDLLVGSAFLLFFAGIRGGPETRQVVAENLSAVDQAIKCEAVAQAVSDSRQGDALGPFVRAAIDDESVAIAAADAALESSRNVAIVAREIRMSSAPESSIEAALATTGEVYESKLRTLGRAAVPASSVLDEVFSVLRALYPRSGAALGTPSTQRLLRCAQDVRRMCQASVLQGGSKGPDMARLEVLASRDVLASALEHGAAENMRSPGTVSLGEEVRFGVNLALRHMSSPAANKVDLLILCEVLLRGTSLSQDDRVDLTKAVNANLVFHMERLAFSDAEVSNSAAWLISELLSAESCRQLSYKSLLRGLRETTTMSLRAAYYRALLRKGAPRMLADVDAADADESAAIERYPLEFRQAMAFSDGDDFGYILTWAAVIDLVCGDEEGAGGSEANEAFRRASTEFLRADQVRFDEFLSVCANHALDVSQDKLQDSLLVPASDSSFEGFECTVSSGDLSLLAARTLYLAFLRLPALSRRWFNEALEKSSAKEVELFAKRAICPRLVRNELQAVKSLPLTSDTGDAPTSSIDSDFGVSVSLVAREVAAKFLFSEVTFEIIMRVPDNFPLRPIDVEGGGRVSISESRWRGIMLGIRKLLSMNNGTIAEAVAFWRKNLDRLFQGVEDCPICFAVLHYSTSEVPKLTCRTCKKKFHKACLYKWFNTANSATCPMCRSVFMT